MVLQPSDRAKLDPTEDRLFYDFPRFVTHVDDPFIQQLTDLYRQQLKPQTRILDLMSSWVSHLPEEISFEHVEGHGMNAEELAANPRLDHYIIQDLNQQPQLPFPDQSFDAVLIAVSIQYLQYPEVVLAEIARILTSGGVVIVSFSNRMFFQKAIQIWRDGSDRSRIELVKRYIEAIPGFSPPQAIVKIPPLSLINFLGLAPADPFLAVIATYEQAS